MSDRPTLRARISSGIDAACRPCLPAFHFVGRHARRFYIGASLVWLAFWVPYSAVTLGGPVGFIALFYWGYYLALIGAAGEFVAMWFDTNRGGRKCRPREMSVAGLMTTWFVVCTSPFALQVVPGPTGILSMSLIWAVLYNVRREGLILRPGPPPVPPGSPVPSSPLAA